MGMPVSTVVFGITARGNTTTGGTTGVTVCESLKKPLQSLLQKLMIGLYLATLEISQLTGIAYKHIKNSILY